VTGLPRFYVRESSGYLDMPGSSTKTPTTEVIVLDRCCNHRTVFSAIARGGCAEPGRRGAIGKAEALARARRQARELCRQWNMEDRASVEGGGGVT
jgi:hypothetical protein